jgi:SulP family sulfate permease
LLVVRTAPLSTVAMLVTFVATTELPLHTAILIGAITSLVLYCAKASQAARLIALSRSDDGWYIVPVPDRLPSDSVTVLQYAGVGLFAEVPRIDEDWPQVADSHNAVVVLGMAMLPDVPSSKVIKSLRRWAGELQACGGRMIIAGVSPATAKVFERGGLVDILGPGGVIPLNNRVFGAIEQSVESGERWIAERREEPPVTG